MKKQFPVFCLCFLLLSAFRLPVGAPTSPETVTSELQGAKFDPTGTWLVPDPRDGKPWLLVEIRSVDGTLQGTLKAYPAGSRYAGMKKCELCPRDDKRKNAPMAGIVIVEKLTPLGNRFVNGEYLDLENGRVYNCNVSIPKADELWVEVSYGRMYKKQLWKRVKP